MSEARIYRRRNGEWGASCGTVMDVGNHIVERKGRFTVYSSQDMREDVVIAKNATREEAEAAIAKDWQHAR